MTGHDLLPVLYCCVAGLLTVCGVLGWIVIHLVGKLTHLSTQLSAFRLASGDEAASRVYVTQTTARATGGDAQPITGDDLPLDELLPPEASVPEFTVTPMGFPPGYTSKGASS